MNIRSKLDRTGKGTHKGHGAEAGRGQGGSCISRAPEAMQLPWLLMEIRHQPVLPLFRGGAENGQVPPGRGDCEVPCRSLNWLWKGTTHYPVRNFPLKVGFSPKSRAHGATEASR